MREILFRGKRIDNGEWVYGFYFCMYHDDDREHLHHFIIPLNVSIPKDRPIGEIQVEVDPETIGQFTGLSDKNGKKIFEGDMLLTSQFGSVWYNATVELKKGAFLVVPHKTYPHEKMHAQIGWLSARLTEVVGNIHDNPELLEGDTDND